MHSNPADALIRRDSREGGSRSGAGQAGHGDGAIMPCVTLIDLALPPLDGLELLRAMRTHEQTRLLPVVVFSSSAEEHPPVDAVYAVGANSYIGLRPGIEPFEESIRQAAHYWCVVNDPPPPPL
jgi:two-component system response regulator